MTTDCIIDNWLIKLKDWIIKNRLNYNIIYLYSGTLCLILCTALITRYFSYNSKLLLNSMIITYNLIIIVAFIHNIVILIVSISNLIKSLKLKPINTTLGKLNNDDITFISTKAIHNMQFGFIPIVTLAIGLLSIILTTKITNNTINSVIEVMVIYLLIFAFIENYTQFMILRLTEQHNHKLRLTKQHENKPKIISNNTFTGEHDISQRPLVGWWISQRINNPVNVFERLIFMTTIMACVIGFYILKSYFST